MRHLTLAHLFVSLLPAAGVAQELLWERVGVRNEHRFGNGSAWIGDLDGDGYREMVHLVQVALGPPPFPATEFQVWTLDGRTGATRRVLGALASNRTYDVLASAGDVNGDGLDDYAVAVQDSTQIVPFTRTVQVRSGLDDSLVWSMTDVNGFGSAVVGGLNLGRDGPGLAVTVPGGSPRSSPSEVRLYSASGQHVMTMRGDSLLVIGNSTRRTTLASAGDVDGDGVDDLVVGGTDLTRSAGAAIVLSCRTGRVLTVGRDPRPGDFIGASVGACGDVNGDRVPDFVAGNSVTTQRGVVAVFSGVDGRTIHEWNSTSLGPGFEASDISRSRLDVDRDGVPDVVVGADTFTGTASAVFVFSGRDATILSQLQSPDSLGSSVSVVGRLPGSPFESFSASDPRHVPGGPALIALGRVAAYRGAVPKVAVVGEPCAGSLNLAPRIGVRSSPRGGTRVTVMEASPGQQAVLLLGTSRDGFAGFALPLSLSHLGYSSCWLWNSVDVPVSVMAGNGSALESGFAFVDLPAQVVPAGLPVFAQWLSVGVDQFAPGGLSDSLSLFLQ